MRLFLIILVILLLAGGYAYRYKRPECMKLVDDLTSLWEAPPQSAPVPWSPPAAIPAQANWTWTTSDGKTYQDVRITKVEADCVTILDADGGARISIATLPPDLQKELNYDPAAAAQASARRGGP
jgi:hypothetical protein